MNMVCIHPALLSAYRLLTIQDFHFEAYLNETCGREEAIRNQHHVESKSMHR